MRLLVFGGRAYKSHERVWREIDRLVGDISLADVTIIHGDADSGADAHAKAWAENRAREGVKVVPYPADWKNITRPGAVIRYSAKHGEYDVLAGFVRNQRMLDAGKPTHALEFPGRGGTADMHRRIELAIRCGTPITLRVIET
jgi:hypothetical protein